MTGKLSLLRDALQDRLEISDDETQDGIWNDDL